MTGVLDLDTVQEHRRFCQRNLALVEIFHAEACRLFPLDVRHGEEPLAEQLTIAYTQALFVAAMTPRRRPQDGGA